MLLRLDDIFDELLELLRLVAIQYLFNSFHEIALAELNAINDGSQLQPLLRRPLGAHVLPSHKNIRHYRGTKCDGDLVDHRYRVSNDV